MKALLFTSLLALSFSGLAQVSASPNLSSKLRIQAVLNAVTGTDEVVTAVEAAGNNLFLVSITQGECQLKELYQVTAIASSGPVPKMTARFVDLEENSCR